MTKKKDPKDYKKNGRPTVMTEAVIAKLEQGFKIGLNDTECCAYAEIGRDAFYDYIKKNPEFADKKEEWKRNPIAKAKYTIYKNLADPNIAKWLLERRDDDYSNKIKQEVTNTTPQIVVATQADAELLKEIQNVKPN